MTEKIKKKLKTKHDRIINQLNDRGYEEIIIDLDEMDRVCGYHSDHNFYYSYDDSTFNFNVFTYVIGDSYYYPDTLVYHEVFSFGFSSGLKMDVYWNDTIIFKNDELKLYTIINRSKFRDKVNLETVIREMGQNEESNEEKIYRTKINKIRYNILKNKGK